MRCFWLLKKVTPFLPADCWEPFAFELFHHELGVCVPEDPVEKEEEEDESDDEGEVGEKAQVEKKAEVQEEKENVPVWEAWKILRPNLKSRKKPLGPWMRWLEGEYRKRPKASASENRGVRDCDSQKDHEAHTAEKTHIEDAKPAAQSTEKKDEKLAVESTEKPQMKGKGQKKAESSTEKKGKKGEKPAQKEKTKEKKEDKTTGKKEKAKPLVDKENVELSLGDAGRPEVGKVYMIRGSGIAGANDCRCKVLKVHKKDCVAHILEGPLASENRHVSFQKLRLCGVKRKVAELTDDADGADVN